MPCPACELKLVLNGDVASKNLEAICEVIERYIDAGKKFSNINALVDQANLIEDEVDKFRRMVLEGMGFQGPWPHSLRA